MKNTNITLHTTQKKEYVLTGILSLPLHLGERAWIYSYNQTFATSPVQSILEVSENGVVFETYIIGFGHAGADFLQHPGSLYHLVDDGTLFLHICIRIQDQPVEQHRFCIGRSGQVDVSDQFFIRLLILCLQHFQRHMFPVLL